MRTLQNKEKKTIGQNYCISKIPKDVWQKNKDSAVYSFEEKEDGKILCFVGISLHSKNSITLNHEKDWDYLKMLPHIWDNSKSIRFFADDYKDMKSPEIAALVRQLIIDTMKEYGVDGN